MPKKLAVQHTVPAGSRARGRKKTERQTAVRSRARRLDPTIRRDLILDSAATLVVERGITNCTLEAVGAAARVSKALVYRYFPSRQALFGALLTREFDDIRGRKFNLTPARATFHDALKIHIPRYMEYVAKRGALLRVLTRDVGVMEQIKVKSRMEQREILDYWMNQVVDTYGIPADLARLGSIMVIAAEEAAEGSLRRGKVPLDRAADFWITFVAGGWAAVAKNHSR